VESLLRNNLSQPATQLTSQDALVQKPLPIKSSRKTWINIQRTTSFQTLVLIMISLPPKTTTEKPVENSHNKFLSQLATLLTSQDALLRLTLTVHGNKRVIQLMMLTDSQHQPLLGPLNQPTPSQHSLNQFQLAIHTLTQHAKMPRHQHQST